MTKFLKSKSNYEISVVYSTSRNVVKNERKAGQFVFKDGDQVIFPVYYKVHSTELYVLVAMYWVFSRTQAMLILGQMFLIRPLLSLLYTNNSQSTTSISLIPGRAKSTTA